MSSGPATPWAVRVTAVLMLVILGVQFHRLAWASGSPWRRARGADSAAELLRSQSAELSTATRIPDDLGRLIDRRDEALDKEYELQRRISGLGEGRSALERRSSSAVERRLEDHARATGVEIVSWRRDGVGRASALVQDTAGASSAPGAQQVLSIGPVWSLTLRGEFERLEHLSEVLAADPLLPTVRSFRLQPDPNPRTARKLVLELVLFEGRRFAPLEPRGLASTFAADEK